MKRIGIIGMGGIGGFIGAPLASYYSQSEEAEIIFICRGETLSNIKTRGLLLKVADDEISAHPKLASDDVGQIGKLDVVFITTKAYALRGVLEDYKEVLKEDTVLIPLQNMVNAGEVIHETLSGSEKVLEGCIYVASNIKEPGLIEHKGGPGKVFIGGGSVHEYQWLLRLLSQAGIDVTFSENIKTVLWTKYMFVSPVAGITTAYNKSFGELLADSTLLERLEGMMREVKKLAAAQGVFLPETSVSESIALLNRFPFAAKSSLQIDFEQGKRTEKEYLIDFVVERCRSLGIPSEGYQAISTILDLRKQDYLL